MEQLKTKREKINGNQIRKSAVVNDMLHSFRNASMVSEKINQFSNFLKLLAAANCEYQQLLRKDEPMANNQFLDEQNERIITFKHNIINWLKEAGLNKVELNLVVYRNSKCSSSSNASSLSSIKYNALEEKTKVAKPIAESNFIEQKLKMECEENRLEIEKKVAKSQARTRVLDLLDMPPSEAEKDAKTQVMLLLIIVASLEKSQK